jgi:hypothetical protein
MEPIMEDQDNKFTISKATELLKNFSDLMINGCVSRSVYDSRRSACETCEFNQRRASDGSHFCGSCGCGARKLATIYIEGVPVEEDHSPRLWMPKSNCPKDLHSDEKGTGDFKPIGGKLKQLKEFTIATLAEAAGASGANDKLEYVNRTVDIIEQVATEEELDSLSDLFDEPAENESPQDYNNAQGDNHEKQENSHPSPKLRPDQNRS